ncbi:MAG: PfkB family carbohydrate kinase, partial [Halohasta sp.]
MRPQPPGPNGVPVLGNSHQFADDPFAFLDACADAYGDVVGFDLGPQPLYMLTHPRDIERVLVGEASSFPKLDLGDDAVDHPGFAVDTVDTTGAGDAFVAGAISASREGRGLAEAVAFANAVAATATTAPGAMTALPTRD